MKPQEFIANATRTESSDFMSIMKRFTTTRTIRLTHAAFGLVTEAGELLDALKKHLFYGKEIDSVNVKEECGDILWYLAILFDEMGWSFEEVMELVILKLKCRYPNKFASLDALNRNLASERSCLAVDQITDCDFGGVPSCSISEEEEDGEADIHPTDQGFEDASGV